MLPSLCDTDTLSLLIKKNPMVVTNTQAYLGIHRVLIFSLMTRYENIRGLKAKQASVQLAAFEQFCGANRVLPLTDNIILRATDIYADLYRRGMLIGDADILIAATALENGLIVVTNNTNHFNRISGLQLQNWLLPQSP